MNWIQRFQQRRWPISPVESSIERAVINHFKVPACSNRQTTTSQPRSPSSLLLPRRRLAQSSYPSSSYGQRRGIKTKSLAGVDVSTFHSLEPRTFSIIAHIDHGKSTLADRLLELTNTIPKDSSTKQFLDKLLVEQERGITVKSQAVSMLYRYPGPDDPSVTSENTSISPSNVSEETTSQLTEEDLLLEQEIKFLELEMNPSLSIQKPTKGDEFLLQMLDTPGHMDFGDEVKRSLSACQTALLVVDATQGIQAQTISVYQTALQKNLLIIPILNKIDLPASDPSKCISQMKDLLGLDVSLPGLEPIEISAKTGKGVDRVLKALVERTKPLKGCEKGGGINPDSTGERKDGDGVRDGKGFRALVIDSWFDQFRGVVALLSVADGAVRKGDKITSIHSNKKYEVLDLGVNSPEPISTGILRKGQVGWLICNMKDMKDASIGDTLHLSHEQVEPLEGFNPPTPMVFAGIFPLESSDFLKLEDSINRLALNDRSVSVSRESSMALGQGCRLGFLGTLHLDVFRQRLEDEYKQEILITNPTVPYKLIDRLGKEIICNNPIEFPDETDRKANFQDILEPMVKGKIRVPEEFTGKILEICKDHRGQQIDVEFSETISIEPSSDPSSSNLNSLINTAATPNSTSTSTSTPSTNFSRDTSRFRRTMTFTYLFPLSEIVTDFVSKIKSSSSGFASFEYSETDYQSSDLVKMSFLISGTSVDALSLILHRSKLHEIGRIWVKKLREKVPRQQFEVAIQAVVGSKVVARESLSAYRKDVTSGLYGGHYERKLKHLNKQKEGKKRLKMMGFGRVSVPTEAFLEILDSRPKAQRK